MCDCRYWWRPSLRPGRGVVWPSSLRQAGGGKSTPPSPTHTPPPGCCYHSYSCPVSLLTGGRCYIQYEVSQQDVLYITLTDNQTFNLAIPAQQTLQESSYRSIFTVYSTFNKTKRSNKSSNLGDIMFVRSVTFRQQCLKVQENPRNSIVGNAHVRR